MAEILKPLLEISLAASVMIGVILIIRKVFAKKMNAAVMLVLWAIVLLRLCIPFTYESPVSLANVFSDQAVSYEASNDLQKTPLNNITSSVQSPTTGSDIVENGTNVLPQSGEKTINPGSSVLPQSTTSQPTFMETLNRLMKSMPVWVILTTIWLTGTMITILVFIQKFMRFTKRLAYCKPIKNVEILKTIERQKKNLGVKKEVLALECNFVHVPAVFGYLKPRILIPSQFMRNMDKNSLKAIMLHEVYHIRCHDILINYIWLVAKAVHWFNPLVWLAYKKFDDDVELCRDQNVARRLGMNGTLDYSQSLVEAARISKKSVSTMPSLTAALFENKSKIKERVIRLVKPQKRNKSAVFVSALLALLMIVTCFTTACQPTPENEAVIGRQDDVLDAVEPVASDDFEPIQVPDHISETHDDFPYVKISYDADVVVPEVSAYPVTEVTKRVLTEDDILEYIDMFAGSGYEMYFGWTLSKDDYLALLTKVLQYKGTERVTKEDLDRIQELYDKATNDVVNQPIGSLSDIPVEFSPLVNIKTADGEISQVAWERDGNYLWYTRNYMVQSYPSSSLTDEQYSKNMDGSVEHFNWMKPGEPDISQEDAYAIALQYLDSLGIDLELYSAEPCSFIKDYVDKTTGWQFVFTRAIAGLQTIDTVNSTNWTKETAPSYGSPWGEEQLVISVDKTGLFGLNWKGASTVSRTVADSAQLIDFETIHQRITDQLSYKYGFSDDDSKIEIEISEVRLGISMISLENRTDVGEYLPTWYVSYRYKGENEDDNAWQWQQIMFNATDGSYIEPRITVNDLMGNIAPTGS